MTLSAYTDGNRFLDQDKLKFADATAYLGDVTSADRLIKAALFEIFGSVVNTWAVSPTPPQVAPPEIVQDISGMLAASYFYRRIYSEETTAQPLYADDLENRALALIDKLRMGTIGLDDETYTSNTQFSDSDFFPNDAYVDTLGNPIRYFGIEDVY